MHEVEKKNNLKEHTHPSICQLWIKYTECIYSANSLINVFFKMREIRIRFCIQLFVDLSQSYTIIRVHVIHIQRLWSL